MQNASMIVIAFIACTIPFFRDIMSFIGALGFNPTTFWM